MKPYVHNVKFYETDKMSISHHSNYIRWMEEARLDFLQKNGCDYRELEKAGIISPVVSVNCKFIKTTTFGDDVEISLRVREFNGVKLLVEYEMKSGGEVVCIAESAHCFVREDMKIVSLKKAFPEYFERLKANVD